MFRKVVRLSFVALWALLRKLPCGNCPLRTGQFKCPSIVACRGTTANNPLRYGPQTGNKSHKVAWCSWHRRLWIHAWIRLVVCSRFSYCQAVKLPLLYCGSCKQLASRARLQLLKLLHKLWFHRSLLNFQRLVYWGQPMSVKQTDLLPQMVHLWVWHPSVHVSDNCLYRSSCKVQTLPKS